jgi:hypothetical protein
VKETPEEGFRPFRQFLQILHSACPKPFDLTDAKNVVLREECDVTRHVCKTGGHNIVFSPSFIKPNPH